MVVVESVKFLSKALLAQQGLPIAVAVGHIDSRVNV